MSRLRVALRVARRDARRARGRSALVVAMIALPVLGVGTADVLWRTFQLSPEQLATRTIGAADALVEDSGQTRTDQLSLGGAPVEGQLRAGPPPAPSTFLPAGARVVADRRTVGDAVVEGRRTFTDVRALDLADPVTAGIYDRVSGEVVPAAGEAVLTEHLADRLGLGLGEVVTVELRDPTAAPGGPGGDGRRRAGTAELRVVGLVASTRSDRESTVLVDHGFLSGVPTGLDSGRVALSYLVDLTAPPVLDDVRRVNAAGFSVLPRTPVPGTPDPEELYGGGSSGDLEVAAVVALVVGMALLEVVLLAGPAFAVGAKRRSRDLALLAATGGARSDVRRTVLAGGVVLGGLGGLVGAVSSIGLAAVAVPVLVRASGDLPGPFDVRPLELLAIAAVGTLTALIAALVPARTAARQDVVGALTGRRGSVRGSRALPVAGLVAAVVGAAVAFVGASRRELSVVLAGSVIAELGLVATTPALVGLAGRLSPLLPVAPRLALRDAARNRGRTAPAVAAVLAAVAGSIAVSTYVASLDRHDRAAYTPSAPPASVVLGVYDAREREVLPAAQAALQRVLPDHRVARVETLTPPAVGQSLGHLEVEQAPGQQCPAFGGLDDGLTPAERRRIERTDDRCRQLPVAQVGSGVLVGDARVVEAVTTHRAASYDRALAAGGAVVPAAALRPDGTAVVVVHPAPRADGTEDPSLVRRVAVPAVALPREGFQATVLSPSAANRLGVGAPVPAGLVATGPMPTEAQEDRLRAAVRDAGLMSSPVVERGYQSDYGLGLLALVVGSAVVVLGASSIATGLAAADARADLSTLAAVGASPGVRRRLAAYQSAVTAGLGTLLGVVAGLVPAVGLILALNRPPSGAPAGFERSDPFEVVLPWASLAVTALVVPALAALAAGVLTRSRLPLVRRLA